jgi:hypothetical protein
VRLRHDAPVLRATFDDPNLVSCAGLVPVMRLAQDVGLHDAVADRVWLPGDKGSNPAGKVATIVAGMLAGADSIDDLDIARYHAVFTDSPFVLTQAEAQHRGHAIIEQVNADLIAGPLAHLPSGRFSANDAWLTCAAIAHNLTRAAGHLAAGAYATARPATIRTRIINVAARIAHRARAIHLHLPDRWPWQAAFENLYTATAPG